MTKIAGKGKNENFLEKYLNKLENPTDSYFVPDYPKENHEEIKTLFILESPHVDEIEGRKPLQGSAGKNVSDFFGLTKPFGEEKEFLIKHKIGIVNVSNIPLQLIDKKSDKHQVTAIELNSLRTSKSTNSTLYAFFQKKMKKYKKVDTFIICGAFAEKYFDKYILDEKKLSIIKKHYQGKIKILKVPHPSYGHWQFIEKHKDNLEKLRKLFSEVNEK